MIIVKNFGSQNIKDYEKEIADGGHFVQFDYCVSIIIYSFKKPSDVYLIRGYESRVLKGLKYTLFTAIAGWWGIPWGPIFTIQCLFTNLKGGRNVTYEVMNDARRKLNSLSQYF